MPESCPPSAPSSESGALLASSPHAIISAVASSSAPSRACASVDDDATALAFGDAAVPVAAPLLGLVVVARGDARFLALDAGQVPFAVAGQELVLAHRALLPLRVHAAAERCAHLLADQAHAIHALLRRAAGLIAAQLELVRAVAFGIRQVAEALELVDEHALPPLEPVAQRLGALLIAVADHRVLLQLR